MGVYWHCKRVCTESWLGEKSLATLGNWTCVGGVPVRCSANWATSEKDRNMQTCSCKCSACAQKTWSRSVSEVSQRELCMDLRSGKLNRASESGCHLQNCSCERESLAEFTDLATCQTLPIKKEAFSNVQQRIPPEVAFHHRRGEQWYSRELWSEQYYCEMIGLMDSQVCLANSIFSCTESAREVQNVGLPCDFSVKCTCQS